MAEDKNTYLEQLNKAYKESSSQFDKQVLFIASGAFGISLAFIKDIVKLDVATNNHLTTHLIKFNKGDCLYLFTDGYGDQFGGKSKKVKKFMTSNMKKKLEEIHSETMELQGQIMDQTINDWRGDLEQVDDICVIGVRV